MKNSVFLPLLCLLSIQPVSAQAQSGKSSAPVDQEDCTNRAAREAKTAAGLQIMVQNCRKTFPAERDSSGGYRYYDAELNRYIQVSGPKLSRSDLQKLEFLRKQKIEQDKINQQREADRNLAALIASAEREKLARDVAKHLHINKWNIGCGANCYTEKTITVQLTNNSDKSLRGVNFEYELGEGLLCSSDLRLGNSFYKSINIKPKETVNFLYDFGVMASSKISTYNGCLAVRKVDVVE